MIDHNMLAEKIVDAIASAVAIAGNAAELRKLHADIRTERQAADARNRDADERHASADAKHAAADAKMANAERLHKIAEQRDADARLGQQQNADREASYASRVAALEAEKRAHAAEVERLRTHLSGAAAA